MPAMPSDHLPPLYYIRLLKQAVDEVEHRCLDDVVSAYSYVILAALLISSTER